MSTSGSDQNFHSIYSHGFVRVAVGVPFLKVADPQYNVGQTLGLARRAHDEGAALVLFTELGISAYSNDDLFHQDALLDSVEVAIEKVLEASRELAPVLLIGAPLRFQNKLFNCAVVVHGGKVLGVVPKTYLPNYREFYEKRQFASARQAIAREVLLCGQRVPFGNDLVFEATSPHPRPLDSSSPSPLRGRGGQGVRVSPSPSKSAKTFGRPFRLRRIRRSPEL